MDSSTIPLLLLLGVVFPVEVIGANCTSKIQIFEGGKEVNLYDSQCIFFGTDSCKDGSQKLPYNLSYGGSVDKPRNFSTQIFVDSNYQWSGNTYAAPGVIFTWQAPLSGTSRQYTKGYWLEMKEVQSAVVLCRVIDLSGYNLSLTTSFQLKLFPLNKQVSYIVQLYSLPPPSQEEMNEELYAQSVASLPGIKQLNGPLYPDQWTTWINIERDPKGGSVKVTFGFANMSFKFEQYKLRLYSFNESRSIDETFIPQVHTKIQGEYTFQNIPAGIYNVSVRPDDTYLNTPNCLCYSRVESYGRVCSACTTSWTSEFEIKAGLPFSSTETPTSTSDSSKPHTAGPPDPPTSPFTSTTTSNSTSETYIGLIVGAVLGAVIFLAVAILFVFWICTQRKDPRKCLPDHKPGNSDVIRFVAVPFLNTDLKTKDQDPPPIQIRKVFLLAADDHVYHTQAVERFADFLHAHCQADVSFAPQCLSEIHGKNSYCWLAAKIEESDNVLIVASKGAQCLYQAFLKGLAYKRENFGPEGDLFTPGIQHICGMIARNVDVHKILTVHFEYTSSDCCLPIAALPSSVYLLPKHLSSLVQHIHKLTRNMDLAKVNLPLECSVGDLPEGSQWTYAVQKAKAFEQQHVNWLSDKFNNPEESVKCNPPYVSQESGFYSDTGSIHSRHSTGSERRLSSASRYPEGCVSDLDCFTPDDFIEPSVYSVYTVVPAQGYKQEELDDGGSFLTEQMKRINQRYENYLHGGQDLSPAETESGVRQQMHLLNAVNEAAWGQGVHSQELNNDYEELDSISVLSAQSV